MSLLAYETVGIEHKGQRSPWRRRPGLGVLKRISDRTGVRVERLGDMTLQSWAPVHRDDEENERFSTKRFFLKAHENRQFRFVVCTECLKLDAIPYLRLSWMIGWMAVCPLHKTIMTTRCTTCQVKLRTPMPAWTVPFSPLNCSGCQAELSSGQLPAELTMIRLQEALLKGKREGFTVLEGLGEFSWPKMVALADVLIGIFSIDVKGKAHRRSFRKFKADINAQREGLPRSDMLISRSSPGLSGVGPPVQALLSAGTISDDGSVANRTASSLNTVAVIITIPGIRVRLR
jgi:hypothetical protein